MSSDERTGCHSSRAILERLMLARHIGDYHFLADPETGITFRWGKTLDDNPLFAPVPELADISISNRCTKGCSFCYKDSTPNGKLMTIQEYCQVLDSLCSPENGTIFQIAVGGGEPLEHPDFLDIVNETAKRGIVLNFTTNGLLLTPDIFTTIRGKVGALAISAASMEELKRVIPLLDYSKGIKVNLHYILSNESIQEAIDIVKGEYNDQLDGINAVVFLTYKPAGRGAENAVLRKGAQTDEFIKAIKTPKISCKIGFDACFVPMLMRNHTVRKEMVDVCEGGFFSVYIDEYMRVSPCSFSGGRDSYSLKEYSFYDIWLDKLQPFREKVAKNTCQNECAVHNLCKGACPYYPQITNCYTK